MDRNPQNENADQQRQACLDWQPLLMLSAAGELEGEPQARLAAHLAGCASCTAALAQEEELLALFAANRSEPDAAMLASFRASLDDALDQQEERGWFGRALGLGSPVSWLSLQPVLSAALLLIVGFSVGILTPRLLRHPAVPATSGTTASTEISTNPASPAPPAPVSVAASSPALAGFDIHSADVAGISVIPSDEGLPRVQLQMKSQQPVMVEGTLDDDQVKSALLRVLSGGDRFCPDIRLDAVECLRGRSNDPEVRSALCRAARKDGNAAVRLKAIEALDGAGSQQAVRETLLDALVDDQNPGVRIEAINALRNIAASGQMDSDDHTVDVLRERMQKDPNTYIRLQSAAAIRDIGPRQKF